MFDFFFCLLLLKLISFGKSARSIRLTMAPVLPNSRVSSVVCCTETDKYDDTLNEKLYNLVNLKITVFRDYP